MNFTNSCGKVSRTNMSCKNEKNSADVFFEDTEQYENINTAARESFRSCCHKSADENKSYLAEPDVMLGGHETVIKYQHSCL